MLDLRGFMSGFGRLIEFLFPVLAANIFSASPYIDINIIAEMWIEINIV